MGRRSLAERPTAVNRALHSGEARHLRQHPKNDDRLGFDRVKFKS
jgi:hypothetical protein